MPSIGEICMAVHDSIALVASLAGNTQNYNELTEGMNDTPGAQIYPEEGECDIDTETDRTTFTDSVTDLFVEEVASVAMERLVSLTDAI